VIVPRYICLLVVIFPNDSPLFYITVYKFFDKDTPFFLYYLYLCHIILESFSALKNHIFCIGNLYYKLYEGDSSSQLFLYLVVLTNTINNLYTLVNK
jgi:hypothetical protein